MSTSSPLPRHLASLVTAFLILLGFGSPARAIDDNATKQIWKLKYGVTDVQIADSAPGGWLDQDSDGDGIKNKDEIPAGTNPFKPTSVLKVTSITNAATTVAITFPTENGKQYVVQGTPALATTFANTASAWDGVGGPKTLTVTKGSNKFFRVLVKDIDTDSDGVSNWAELAVGLNPVVGETISGQTTLAYVNAQIALPNEVTITAAAPFASEDGPTAGKMTVTRTQDLFPITVNLGVSGTAVPSVDYTALSNSVVFPARGATSSDIPVTPITQATVKGDRSVTAALSPPGSVDFPYVLRAPADKATVIINPSAVPTGTGLLGRYYDTASTTYTSTSNFGKATTYTYTRTVVGPPASGTIVVAYTGPATVAVSDVVRLTFTSGNLNNALYNDKNYTVTAVNAGVSFTVGIASATTLPASGTGNCSLSVPASITRVDPTVNFDWQYGTPNGVVISPANSPDNYSAAWDTYLQPTVAGDYTFQLDADDKARVLLDTGSGLVQILEHNWTTPGSDPVGTFKQSGLITLAVPGSPAARYHMRVEHVETTGDARCRLQWKVPGATSFSNIAQANQFPHTTAMSYSYTRSGTTPSFTGAVVVTPTGGHSFTGGETVTLSFSSGNLFTPGGATTYNADYVITAVSGTVSYTVATPSGATLPASGTGNGFVLNTSASTTTGLYNLCYANTGFTGSPGRVGVDTAVTSAGSTNNNGIWGPGTPDVNLIVPDSFSIRWTGQVQPQFSEDYTFVVQADDGCLLKINGQTQALKMAPAANTGGSTYAYDATTGDIVVTYSSLVAVASSFVAGETVRFDPSSGNLAHAPTTPPTYTYDETTGIAVVNYSNLPTRTPGSFVVGETVEMDPTSGNLTSLSNLPYVVVASPAPTTTTFAVAISPSVAISSISTGFPCEITTAQPHGLLNGQAVRISAVTGGTFLPAINALYTVTVTGPNTFTVLSNCTVAPTPATGAASGPPGFASGSGNITINDNRNAVITSATPTTFTVNIGPGKYANASTGNVNVDIANKTLKDWSSNGNERFLRIPMVGGRRYDIQLDYYENTVAAKCILSWYSPSQPKQVIPQERLYPSSLPSNMIAPPAQISPTDAVALVGGGFSYQVAGSNGATVTLSDKPSWLNYDSLTGILSGTPPTGAAGDYQIIVTTTSAAGLGTSVLNLHVDENTGTVPREYWTGVAGTTVASIPTGSAPTGTANLTSLAAPTDFGDNYGARIRGYIEAPVTGNYYFWIAANNAAELWISNDDEPNTKFKRAWVTTGSSTPQNWSGEANQKSEWLALEQGKKYYFEILHKAGVGSGDNLAVGWAKPGEATTAPSQVVPGYALSPYVAPTLAQTPGTLYVATMLSQSGAATTGVGSSNLRLSADENTAYMKYNYSGLTGPITSQHIHTDPYLAKPSTIVFDIDTPATPGDGLITNPADPNFGAYKWTITPVGTLTKADIIEVIKEGKAYINLHTALYPNGEIRGNYTLANGTQIFTPPPAPPAWTDDAAVVGATGDAARVRFLTQATFGASTADIAALKTLGSYDAWINDQFTKPVTRHLPEVLAREIADAFGPFDVRLSFNTWWKTSISAQDQLRQKVACALSEIHVVSGQGPLLDNSRAISHFYDALVDNAFGNFKDLLVGTTLTPGMGRYLDMLRNDKPDLAIGRSPNENYAREIKQLFSIGLYRMWPDGSLMLTSKDSPIDTYTQREIVGLAHVFTGWDYGYDGSFHTSFSAATDWTRPMREVPVRHFTGPKRVLNNVVFPGLGSVGGQSLDAYATHISTNYNDAAYQALPAEELDAAHAMLFNHPNVGPFICRQLIQRLVTSDPSRDYLYRVVQKFNDNGSGVRGDMKAVIKAILLDYEARSSDLLSIPAYGKQREPMMRVANAARALRPTGATGTYSQSGTNAITITTPTVHRLEVGDSVFLEFTDTTGDPLKPAPSTGTYTVVTVPTTLTYTINASGWITGTYSQPANSSVMTITLGGHWLPAGGQAFFDFTSGPASGVVGFDVTTHTAVTSTAVDFPGGSGNNSGSTFTIAGISPTSASARSGNVMICRFVGSYGASGGNITIDTAYASAGGAASYGTQANHGLQVGDNVFLNFITTRDTTSGNPTTTGNDDVYPVAIVPDLNSFVVTAKPVANAAINNDNGVYAFPLIPQPLVRSGSVSQRLGTFNMDVTDTDLGQTPLNSPTVFNFFLPSYKYPGALASQGITTPEFQNTAETTVVSLSNFLYNGVFFPSGDTNGISSFKTGSNSLVLDMTPWFGNATNTVLGNGPQTGQKWTSNANLPTLIDRMNTLLLAGQLPAAAKASIQNFLFRTFTIASLNSPVVITSNAHGLVNGDSITISGVTGGTFSTPINATFTVSNVTANTFTVPSNYTAVNSLSTASAHFSPIAYNNSSPSSANVRDRLRAVLHFILTSPDYTIQR